MENNEYFLHPEKYKARKYKIFRGNFIHKTGFLYIFLACCICATPQLNVNDPFKLATQANNSIQIGELVSSNHQFQPFATKEPITGLTFSGQVILHSDSSLVRIILIDAYQNEYLVYETYSLLAVSNEFSVENSGEETSMLNYVIPSALRVEITDAEIFLKELLISKAGRFVAQSRKDLAQLQRTAKIAKINENIEKKGLKWVAGETSVSKLSYAEKKQLFGGKVPNLQGFEYYKGGLFVLPGALENDEPVLENGTVLSQATEESACVSEFSWRKRHGQNWNTPVKYQGGCGSCWAFASTASVELLVNLYYNQHLDMDLSEQDVLSCSGGGNCIGGWPSDALYYISETGVTNETCFPYTATDNDCSNKCSAPDELIKIAKSTFFSCDAWFVDELKRTIINGSIPVSRIQWSNWNHAVPLIGYKEIQAGDTVYIENSQTRFIINEADPLIGETAWLFKNSWGDSWGNDGFGYLVTDINNFCPTYIAHSPITSINYSENDIICTDNDSDGYYNWGIGLKPSHCPSCPDEADGDDADPCLGLMDKSGHIHKNIPQPVSYDTTIMYGEQVPDLEAVGENIKWYSNTELNNIVHTGNRFSTGHTEPGIYPYYITQTVSGCEGRTDTIILTIKIEVPSPYAEDIIICEGMGDTSLIASGENIKWYSAPTNPLYDLHDRQVYSTVIIGKQIWMAENLNYYTSEGSIYYNNDSITYAELYGRLYDFNTACKICPDGWHLPTDNEWKELEMFLGMSKEEANKDNTYRGTNEGGKLKEIGTLNWKAPNIEATDEYGFKALPAGYYLFYPGGIGLIATFWTSTKTESYYSCYRLLNYDKASIYRDSYSSDDEHYSVRCIKNLSEPVAVGNTCNPGFKSPGIYTYYVTQTMSGFESPADTVTLTINQPPPPPLAEYVNACDGELVPDLTAMGNNVQWYSDTLLMNLIHTGNSYATGVTQPGTYMCFVTQTISDCRSQGIPVRLVIHSLPLVSIGNDTTINTQQNLTLGFDNEDYTYLWSNGSDTSTIEISGMENGEGEYTYWLVVTDSNSCINADTISVSIVSLSNIPAPQAGNSILIRPNPGREILYIDFHGIEHEDLSIQIIDQLGNEVYADKIQSIGDDGIIIDIPGWSQGCYTLLIIGNKTRYTEKIIIY